MSVRWLSRCWPVRLSPSRKMVLISLADQANEAGVAWPSVELLVRRCCVAERTVRNALRSLEDDGLIAVKTTGRNSHYRLNGPAIDALCPVEDDAPNDDVLAVPELDDARQELPVRPANFAGQRGSGCRSEGQQLPPNHQEPNTNTTPIPPAEPGGIQAANDPGAGSGPGGGGRRGGKEKQPPRELAAWLRECRLAGVKPIPADDPVWAYAARVGIGEDLVALCWREFKRRHSVKAKRYRCWAQVFRNCVESNWYGLWFVKPGQPAQLTSQGEQVRRYFEAEDAQPGQEAA